MTYEPKVFEEIGVMIPSCLLPSSLKPGALEDWVTIACDQYPHNIKYWSKLYLLRKEIPSTLHLVLPNVFLVEPKAVLTHVEMLIHDEYEMNRMEIQRKEMFETRMKALKRVMIDRINRRMIEYVEEGIIKEFEPCIEYIERTLHNGTIRKGILLCIDLEKYDYSDNSTSLIRPTKKTIPERIMTRLEIRKKATLEVPHVLIFVDDQENELIEPLSRKYSKTSLDSTQKPVKPMYDFSFVINKKANFIRSYALGEEEERHVISTLHKFASEEHQMRKYGGGSSKPSSPPMLFAVGDGNHSLATAKEHWNYIKTKFSKLRIKPPKNHPARYSLVEVTSLYDKSIESFEPVHRVVKNISFEHLIHKEFCEFFRPENTHIQYIPRKDKNDNKTVQLLDKEQDFPDKNKNCHIFPFYAGLRGQGFLVVKAESPQHQFLEVSTLQSFLDSVGVVEDQLEYIFEEDVAAGMTLGRDDRVAFILPKVEKKDLFRQVIKFGGVPRKAYSIGVSQDKRVYLECRRIQKKDEV